MRSHQTDELVQKTALDLLSDKSPYVRKTALFSILKLAQASPDFVEKFEIIDKLYGMLKSPNTGLLASVIQVLNELMRDSGGMAVNNKILIYLLNRFKEFNEQGQGLIVNLCESHKSLTQEMKLKVMNLLDKRLKSSNSHLVLQICRLFLNFTVDNPDMFAQVLDRIGDSLITMLISTQDEAHFSVLIHIEKLIDLGGAKVFKRDFKRFYIYGDEKRYIQDVRLRILTKITDKTNFTEIFAEICQYSNEINSGLAKAALKALGRLAQQFPKKLDLIFKHLSTCVSLDSEGHGRAYLFDDLVDSLRSAVMHLNTSPDSFSITDYSELGPLLSKMLTIRDFLVSPQAKVDFLWLVAKFCKYIPDSSYLVEGFVNLMEEENAKREEELLNQGSKTQEIRVHYDELIMGDGNPRLKATESDKKQKLSVNLKMQILNSAFYCFCIKPREMFPILGKLFACTIPQETQEALVRDKAKSFYLIMKQDLQGFQEFIRDYFEKPFDKDKMQVQGQELTMERKLELINGINSLTLFYNRSENIFIKPKEHFDKIRKKEGKLWF
jgi:vesicle coat complex subunit